MVQSNPVPTGDNSSRPSDNECFVTPPIGPERRLLEQIVRRTLSEQGDDVPLSPVLLSALHEFAGRSRDEPWESAVWQMVDLVLADWFPSTLLDVEVRREIAGEIAHSLLIDTHAAARLRKFWMRISEIAG